MTDSDKPSFEQLCAQFSYKSQNRLLSENDVAAFFGLKAPTLRLMRHQGRGPEYIKVPGSGFVRYTEQAILKWLADGIRQNTSYGVQQPGAQQLPRPWDKPQESKAAG